MSTPWSRAVVASVVLLSSLVFSITAQATASRTFVASTGTDSHPCTLALPCRGFAAAIAQTATAAR